VTFFDSTGRIELNTNDGPVRVYLEVGKKKAFAGAIDWPGWCRSGRGEEAALENLLAYAPRYARAIKSARLEFASPKTASAFEVVERLKGDATTDFGAPGIPPRSDRRPIDHDDVRQFVAVLEACWRSFDRAVKAAGGKDLRTGPRGGGRDLDAIVGHVLEAEAAYLRRLGLDPGPDKAQGIAAREKELRKLIPTGLEAAARGELPKAGPRGGKRWTPRYYVRRSAWHVLDHAWEIEDRMRK
jgi:hypothetical protein